MKNSAIFRIDRQDFFTLEDMNRREFLKAGVSLAVFTAGLETITGYAATKTPRDRIIPVKEKSNFKI